MGKVIEHMGSCAQDVRSAAEVRHPPCLDWTKALHRQEVAQPSANSLAQRVRCGASVFYAPLCSSFCFSVATGR